MITILTWLSEEAKFVDGSHCLNSIVATFEACSVQFAPNTITFYRNTNLMYKHSKDLPEL